ncbi:MAG: lysophospholipid acyltransferase family protein [Legionella sp.]
MILRRIKTLWILAALICYTIEVCTRSVCKYYFSTPTRPWVDKTIHNWIDKLLNKGQVHYKVVNPLNIQPQPGRATILMCNHSSAYDIPLGFKAFPNHSIRMLAKKELSKIPLFGKGMIAAEFPFVDRKNRYQAIKDLEYAKKLMESGIILWIAPEGTRSKTGKLAPFKKGAFITAIQANAIIIPIAIKGANDILPARSFDINLNQKAEIHIGKPIDSLEFTIENKEELIDTTYKAIKELLD